MHEVKIPAMGESISSGFLSTWHVNDGDVVAEGQLLFELETDKVTSEYLSETGGKISIKAAAEEEVEVGQVVAEIDESVSAPAAPAAAEEAPKADKAPEPAAAPAQAPAASKESSEAVSPAVRRIASETGIDPKGVAGSGKDGRVTKGDMLAAMSAPGKSAGPRQEKVRMSPLRRKIAQRLVGVQHETASLTTFNEVDMSAITSIRKTYQEDFVAQHGVKLGFMSFFVKAAVRALQAIPQINVQIDGEELVQNHYYDIGIAVGTPKGLMVPVVRNCDQLGFADVETEIINYAKKARDGKIAMSDLEGGVFTITNGGIYGSMLSTPILNAPQSAILGMHGIKERAVVVNGEIKIRPMMYLALTYDHRVVDGKEAVTFLSMIKDSLEDPKRMLFNI